jgi:hypothetical protein
MRTHGRIMGRPQTVMRAHGRIAGTHRTIMRRTEELLTHRRFMRPHRKFRADG